MSSVALVLSALQIGYSTWQKIPAKDKKRIKKAVIDKNIALAKRIVAKYRKKKDNPCRVHCSKCGAISPKGYNFQKRMKWLRTHRKRKHGKSPKKR